MGSRIPSLSHLSAHKQGASRHRARVDGAGDTVHCSDTRQSQCLEPALSSVLKYAETWPEIRRDDTSFVSQLYLPRD